MQVGTSFYRSARSPLIHSAHNEVHNRLAAASDGMEPRNEDTRSNQAPDSIGTSWFRGVVSSVVGSSDLTGLMIATELSHHDRRGNRHCQHA